MVTSVDEVEGDTQCTQLCIYCTSSFAWNGNFNNDNGSDQKLFFLKRIGVRNTFKMTVTLANAIQTKTYCI